MMSPSSQFAEKLIESSNQAEPISVVLNVWIKDSPAALKESLRSVSNQTVKASEVLIVIDGSITDELHGIINEFTTVNHEARVVQIAQRTGLWNARNTGLLQSRNELVVLQDADDIMHPERIQHLQRLSTKYKDDILATAAFEFDDESREISSLRWCAVDTQISVKKFFWNNPLSHSTIILRRSNVLAVGGYRNIYFAEDYDLWLRMISARRSIRSVGVVLQAIRVDQSFLQRRAGLGFIRSEIELSRQLKLLFPNRRLLISIRLIMRLSLRLGPKSIRKLARYVTLGSLNPNFPANLDQYIYNKPVKIESSDG